MNISLCLKNSVFRYTAPFLLFMVLTECQRFFNGPTLYWVYGLKTCVTGALLWVCFRGHVSEIAGKWDVRAVVLGLGVAAAWIGLGEYVPHSTHSNFTFQELTGSRLFFLAAGFRLAGAVLVVPIMEELVWRSFLMRYLIKKDFLKVPLGTFTTYSFSLTVVAFTLVHASWEWPGAIITGVAYGGYLIKTRNLRGCILAHAVTNLALGIYVLSAGKWYYW